MLSKILSKKSNELKLEVPVPDFIPYACHYDGNTILTKNGELLQTIKITGFVNESVENDALELRDVVRQSILKNVKNDDFALWIHTVRRKKNLDPGGDFPAGFSQKLNKNWKARNKWDEMYVNELYITVIRDGISASILDLQTVLRSLYFNSLKHRHEEKLAEANKDLKKVVDGMLDTLSPFGARCLQVTETGGICYSEPLQFFAKILNLAETPIPMPISDISEYLATHGVAVGFNTMEVRGSTGKHFGAMFTIKEYHELSTKSLDQFLQLQQEFIITQTLDFINCKKALKSFKKQMEILEAGRDEELAEDIGLKAIVDSDKGSPVDFGDSQMTIFLINDSLKGLDKNIEDAVNRLQQLGFNTTRRDLRMEECFWAQLPANFAYLSRRKAISTSRVGGFASLYNFPAGKKTDNLWGPAVTMLHTANKTPYFFSFHNGDNGHTSIVGPHGAGKTVLMNFLISEARKFNGRISFFDYGQASSVFIRSIGGYYTIINPAAASEKHSFNPLQMDDTKENRHFLKNWMVLLAESFGEKLNHTDREHLTGLVDYVYTLPREQRRLSALASMFGDVALTKKMSMWYGTGEYAHLFDNDPKDIVNLNGMIYGFDMSNVIEDKTTLGPVLSYLFHRIEIALDGLPAIIVLDEAWKLVNNTIFAPGLADWLDRMQAKNAIVIFATPSVPNNVKNEMTSVILDKISTQIYMPNSDAELSSRAYKEVWGLSNREFGMLVKMKEKARHFMLRQNKKSIVATLDLSGLKEVYVLSGDDKTVTMMEGAIKEKGENPDDWLPAFYERVEREAK